MEIENSLPSLVNTKKKEENKNSSSNIDVVFKNINDLF